MFEIETAIVSAIIKTSLVCLVRGKFIISPDRKLPD